MATMKFNKLTVEAVEFGDLVATPHMTQEKRLRVSQLKIGNGPLDRAIDVLSSCFGEDAEEVKAFMKINMPADHLARLQTYLLRGAEGVAELEKRMEKLEDKQIDKVLDQIDMQKDAADE